jgi:hypothetical protein
LADYGGLTHEDWEALGMEKRRSWLVFEAAYRLKAEQESAPDHLMATPDFATSLEIQRLTTLAEDGVAPEETE